MALIDQLQIQGIRNFASGDRKTVIFQSPLTLIVGENGCGKTTVIECIKYALTGEYPEGASSGKNFVHDPRIDKKEETQGVIKLQCIGPNHEIVCISKMLVLSHKNGKENCTNKDTTISRKDPVTGKEKNLGCLKNDSIHEMCNMLGVSKAILSNVIFCHQENSNWPLDEGKKVKEIFDEIFDATKYNKAVEGIKIQRDKLRKELPTIRVQYEAAAKFKKEADEKKQSIYDINKKRDEALRELNNIDETIKPLNEKISALTEKARDMSKIRTQYETKITERDMVLKNCKEIESSIKTKFSGSKTHLKQKLDLFKIHFNEKCSDLKTNEKKKIEYVQEENKIERQINDIQMKLGKLERDEETYRKLNDTFKTSLNSLADVLHLDTAAKSQYSHEEGEELIKIFQRTINSFDSELTTLENTFRNKENQSQKDIDNLRETKASLESEIKSKNKQIEINKAELAKVVNQISDVNQSESTLQLLQTKLNRINYDVDQITKNTNLEQLKADIETWKFQRNDLDDKVTALDADIVVLQKKNVALAELNSLKSRKTDKLIEIQTIKDRHKDTFTALFTTIPEENFKIALNEALHSITFEINNIERDISVKEKNLYTLEADEKNCSKSLRTQERQLSELIDRMNTVLGAKPYKDELERVTMQLKREQEAVSMMTSTEYMFHRYIEKLQTDNPRCPLCKRIFEADYSVPDLVGDLKSKIEKIPGDTNVGKEKIEKLCRLQSSLQELKPVYENINKLQDNEIPSLKDKQRELKENIVKTKSKLNKLKSDLNIPKQKEKKALSLQGDVTLLDQSIREFKNLEREVVRQEIKTSSTKGSLLNLEDALQQQKDNKNELTNLRNRIESNQSILNTHNEKLQSLQKEKNEIQSKQLTVQGGTGVLSSLENRKYDLEDLECVYLTDLQELSEKVAPIETQLSIAKNSLENIKKDHNKKLNDEKFRILEYSRKLDDIKRLKIEVLNFVKRDVLAQLTEVKEKLSQLNREKESINLKRSDCEKIINEINQFIGNQSSEEMDLKNNLSLLEKKEDVAKINEDLKSLEKDIEHLDYKNLENERYKLIEENERLMSKKANIRGRVHEMEEAIRSKEMDLKKDYFMNADQKFLKYVYKMRLYEIFIADLIKYQKALEICLINYHTRKMHSINNLIKDYWVRVYQGNDIDYIFIDAALGGNDKRRTYNYRVVQKKNGVEQDMRNRCSAGQRVLACLIIRLALAETFSRNCGIFALDEPTTNLDIKNSVSLSKALALLVEEKCEQKNFQLIVITHDEEFIENLTVIDKAFVVRLIRDRMGFSNVIHPENMITRKMEERDMKEMGSSRNSKKMKIIY